MRIDPPVSRADRRPPHAGGDGRGRSAARSAGRSAWVARIVNGPECRFVARRAERELVQVGFADDDGAGLAQARHDGRVGVRDVPCAHT